MSNTKLRLGAIVALILAVSLIFMARCGGGTSAECASDDQCGPMQVCDVSTGTCVDKDAFGAIKDQNDPKVDPSTVACPPSNDPNGDGCANLINPSTTPPGPPGFEGSGGDDDDVNPPDDDDDVNPPDDDDDVNPPDDDDDVNPPDDDDVQPDDDDDSGTGCTKDEECMDGTKPKCGAPNTGICVCDGGVCVEGCHKDDDCPVTKPVCDQNTKSCCNDPVNCPQICAASDDCKAYAGYTYCDTSMAPPQCVQPKDCPKNCPADMTLIWAGDCGQAFCIDTYEASKGAGDKPESVPDVLPWTEVSWDEAKTACEAVGKRLCEEDEWKTSCDGKFGLGKVRDFSYGNDYEAGRCNDGNVNPNPLKTGEMPECKTPANAYGGEVVYDLTGNVAEWIKLNRNPPYAIIGGSFQEACTPTLCNLKCNNLVPLGDGNQKRPAIGFRCCKDAT